MSYLYLLLTLFVNILADGRVYEPDFKTYSRDCVQIGFCTSTTDYPNELATELTRRLEEPKTTEPPSVTTRPFQCEPYTEKAKPQTARSGNNWYFLLQTPSNRDIYVVICKDSGNPCSANSSYTCQQEYVSMNILAMDWAGNLLRDKYFQVPFACHCVPKHT